VLGEANTKEFQEIKMVPSDEDATCEFSGGNGHNHKAIHSEQIHSQNAP
jgi:hypothetical protein